MASLPGGKPPRRRNRLHLLLLAFAAVALANVVLFLRGLPERAFARQDLLVARARARQELVADPADAADASSVAFPSPPVTLPREFSRVLV